MAREEKWETVKTREETDELINRIMMQQNHGSKFPGMTYEDGLREMHDWLSGDKEEDPLE